MFSEFEDTVVSYINQKCEIDSEVLNNLYISLGRKYNGEDLIMDEYYKYGWIQISHFILQDSYYVYQYSIGACLALYIVNKLINEESFKEKYLKFLSLGNSVSIEDSLKLLGIDVRESDYLIYGLDYLREKKEELVLLYKK